MICHLRWMIYRFSSGCKERSDGIESDSSRASIHGTAVITYRFADYIHSFGVIASSFSKRMKMHKRSYAADRVLL